MISECKSDPITPLLRVSTGFLSHSKFISVSSKVLHHDLCTCCFLHLKSFLFRFEYGSHLTFFKCYFLSESCLNHPI